MSRSPPSRSSPTHLPADMEDDSDYTIEHPHILATYEVPATDHDTTVAGTDSSGDVSASISPVGSPTVRSVNDVHVVTLQTYQPPPSPSALRAPQAPVSHSKPPLLVPTPFAQASGSEAVYPTIDAYLNKSPVLKQKLTEEKIQALTNKQKQQRHRLCGFCTALIVVTLLTVVAFVGVILYLTHELHAIVDDGSITTGKIADGAVTTDKLSAGTVSLTALSMPLSSLLVAMNYTYNLALALVPLAGTGLVQNVSDSTLSLNIDQRVLVIDSGSGRLSVRNGSVTSQYLAKGAVIGGNIVGGSVTIDKLSNSSVNLRHIDGDTRSSLSSLNDSVNAAYRSRSVSGAGVSVSDNGSVNVHYDTNTFTISDGNTLSLARQSVNGTMIANGAITINKLQSSVFALIPATGSGLANDTDTNTYSVAVVFANASVGCDIEGRLTVLPSSVASTMIADRTVTLSNLSPALRSSLSAINSTASTALSNTRSLLLAQAYLQSQLQLALNITDQQLLASIANTSLSLYEAVQSMNATNRSLLASFNASTYDFLGSLQRDLRALQYQLNSQSSAFRQSLPVAGSGLTVTGSGSVWGLSVDSPVFMVTNDTNALSLRSRSITAQYLSTSAITNNKLAMSSVASSAIANGSVTFNKLTADLRSLFSLLNYNDGGSIANNRLTLGLATINSDVIISRPAGGNLVITNPNANSSVVMASANNNPVLSLSDRELAINGSSINVVSFNSKGIRVTANNSITVTGNQIVFLTSTSGLTLYPTGEARLLSINSTNLNSGRVVFSANTSTTVNAPNGVAITGAVQYRTDSVSVTDADTYTVDFANITTTIIRLTGSPTNSALTLSVSRCTDSAAGTSVMIYNQLNDTVSGLLRVAASSVCGYTNDQFVSYGGSIKLTCMGLYQQQPIIDCARGERLAGGISLTSSALTIANNTVNGSVTTNTATGVVRLAFTPQLNPLKITFTIQSSLLATTASVGGLHLTPISSGVINSEYSDTKQSALYVCVKQQLVGDTVSVTMVNVADPLYVNQPQLLAFVYTIL